VGEKLHLDSASSSEKIYCGNHPITVLLVGKIAPTKRLSKKKSTMYDLSKPRQYKKGERQKSTIAPSLRLENEKRVAAQLATYGKIYSLSTDETPLSVHLRQQKVGSNYPDVGKPMGILKEVDNTLDEKESHAFIMVPDNRLRNPVKKASQGSLLVLLNLMLTLFGFNSDSMLKRRTCPPKKNASSRPMLEIIKNNLLMAEL
jgi:hypothetical protein